MKKPPYDLALIEAACGGGDEESIILLSQWVTSTVRSRLKAKLSRGSIEDNATLSLTYRLVRACHRHNRVPPRELVELLEVVLRQDRMPLGALKPQMDRAAAYIKRHPEESAGQIGKRFGFDRSTMSKLRKSVTKKV